MGEAEEHSLLTQAKCSVKGYKSLAGTPSTEVPVGLPQNVTESRETVSVPETRRSSPPVVPDVGSPTTQTLADLRSATHQVRKSNSVSSAIRTRSAHRKLSGCDIIDSTKERLVVASPSSSALQSDFKVILVDKNHDFASCVQGCSTTSSSGISKRVSRDSRKKRRNSCGVGCHPKPLTKSRSTSTTDLSGKLLASLSSTFQEDKSLAVALTSSKAELLGEPYTNFDYQNPINQADWSAVLKFKLDQINKIKSIENDESCQKRLPHFAVLQEQQRSNSFHCGKPNALPDSCGDPKQQRNSLGYIHQIQKQLAREDCHTSSFDSTANSSPVNVNGSKPEAGIGKGSLSTETDTLFNSSMDSNGPEPDDKHLIPVIKVKASEAEEHRKEEPHKSGKNLFVSSVKKVTKLMNSLKQKKKDPDTPMELSQAQKRQCQSNDDIFDSKTKHRDASPGSLSATTSKTPRRKKFGIFSKGIYNSKPTRGNKKKKANQTPNTLHPEYKASAGDEALTANCPMHNDHLSLPTCSLRILSKVE